MIILNLKGVNMLNNKGNALLIILVTIGLFGALTYTVVNSTRNSDITNTADIEAQIDNSKGVQCHTAVKVAVNMLKTRNECSDSQLNYALADGTNANPDAPIDKSCDVFAPEGGNALPCGDYLIAQQDTIIPSEEDFDPETLPPNQDDVEVSNGKDGDGGDGDIVQPFDPGNF